MVTLPPGTTAMRSGDTSTPVMWSVRRATASRVLLVPSAGV